MYLCICVDAYIYTHTYTYTHAYIHVHLYMMILEIDGAFVLAGSRSFSESLAMTGAMAKLPKLQLPKARVVPLKGRQEQAIQESPRLIWAI